MAAEDWVASHLFLAAPKLFANAKTLRRLRDLGVINDEQYGQIKSGTKALKKLIGDAGDARSVVRRIMAIDPSYLDEDFVNLLRLGNIITPTRAHQMRLMIRSQKAITGKRSDKTILNRFQRLFGVGFSMESVALLRSVGLIDEDSTRRLRALVLGGQQVAETLPQLRHANNLLHMMALLGDGIIDAKTIRAMQYSGLLQKGTAERLAAAIAMGKADWRNFSDAKKVEGLAQRLAYTLAGSFNHETLTFLKALGIINRRQELLLRPAVQIGLLYQRRLQEKWTKRRYRPVAGETPIKSFAKASKQTEAALLRLLADAANDAKKTANRLEKVANGKVGGTARAAQLRNVTKELHDQMQALWEGNGYLTIFGQSEAAAAALESNEYLMRRILGRMDERTAFMLGYNARTNIDQYISRQENTIALSRRVYKNIDLMNGNVDRIINIALLQGKSASELAEDVSRYIRPSVPGGVQYAARRLARTELQNAFHTTTIRYSREMPWVQAYQWHLSGSHPNAKPDICNEYAEDDHGLGVPGQYKKSEVPGKPHPHCLCYLTVVDIGEEEFFRLFNRGFYDRYLKQAAKVTEGGENSYLHDGIQGAFSRIG